MESVQACANVSKRVSYLQGHMSLKFLFNKINAWETYIKGNCITEHLGETSFNNWVLLVAMFIQSKRDYCIINIIICGYLGKEMFGLLVFNHNLPLSDSQRSLQPRYISVADASANMLWLALQKMIALDGFLLPHRQ